MDKFEEAMKHISSFIQPVVEEVDFKSISLSSIPEKEAYLGENGYIFYKLDNEIYYIKRTQKIGTLSGYSKYNIKPTTHERLNVELEAQQAIKDATSISTYHFYNLIKKSLNIAK